MRWREGYAPSENDPDFFASEADGGEVGRRDVDDQTVAAACRGDQDALREVYLSLSPVVLGYLRARGVSDPEGSTSEVFLAVIPKLPTLKGGAGGLRTLVFSIAHARMVDDMRAQARRPATVDWTPADDTRPVRSAEDDALAALGAQRVVQILGLLPSDQREVLRLRIIADLSIEQTAEVMRRSAGAVKQLQRRALASLRDALPERRVTQ